MLCGDEVLASIADIGNSLSRFGIAGQDSPKFIFRSDIGLKSDGSFIVGDGSLRGILKDVEVITPRADLGSSLNWDAVEAILKYGVVSSSRKDLTQIPIMMNDSLLHTEKEKEEMVELCMESLGFPALFLGSSAMFSSFSAGRPTSLVIDLGAQTSRISPIVDGFALRKAAVVSERGGAYITNVLRERALRNSIPLQPQYEVLYNRRHAAGGVGVGLAHPSACSESYRAMHVNDMVSDLKKWLCFVPYRPLPADTRQSIIESLQIPPYELPDGSLVHHRDELCTIGEEVWFPSVSLTSASGQQRKRSAAAAGLSSYSQPDQLGSGGGPVPTIDYPTTSSSSGSSSSSSSSDSARAGGAAPPFTDLVLQALLKSDVDTRRELCTNVIVCGGGAQMDGFIPRLTHEMSALLPSNIKFKVVQSLPTERLHATWIGESILSICGAFQKLWVSQADVKELGAANVVRQRLVY